MTSENLPDQTPRIDEIGGLLKDLTFHGSYWQGWAAISFWGQQNLWVCIERREDVDISPRQIEVLRTILKSKDDLRPSFEAALFEYYKAEVEDCYSTYDPTTQMEVPDSGPPTLSKSSQIWTLINEPEVWIDWHFETPSALEFKLTFNCVWDEEHGLGIRFYDWKPVVIGGWDVWKADRRLQDGTL